MFVLRIASLCITCRSVSPIAAHQGHQLWLKKKVCHWMNHVDKLFCQRTWLCILPVHRTFWEVEDWKSISGPKSLLLCSPQTGREWVAWIYTASVCRLWMRTGTRDCVVLRGGVCTPDSILLCYLQVMCIIPAAGNCVIIIYCSREKSSDIYLLSIRTGRESCVRCSAVPNVGWLRFTKASLFLG